MTLFPCLLREKFREEEVSVCVGSAVMNGTLRLLPAYNNDWYSLFCKTGRERAYPMNRSGSLDFGS